MEYLNPSNLVTKEAVVVDGVLAPNGPAFRALVIYQQTQITPKASEALLEFAKNGLPIYIVGSVPNMTVGATGQQKVSENMDELLKSEVVRVFDTQSFSASTLVADGIPARTRIESASNATGLYTFWTFDVESQSEYVYLYNRGTDDIFNITFAVGADLVPYVLDAWTGSQLPLAVFRRSSTAINTKINVRSNQTTIIAFIPTLSNRQKLHVVDHSTNIRNVYSTENDDLQALVSGNASAWVTLNSGTTIALPEGSMPCSEITDLGSWNLTVEAHGPFLDHPSLEANITTIDVGMLDHLAPWTKIPRIEHASGTGTYRTQFEMLADGSTTILADFGPVLNTMKAWLNGKQVPAIDPTNPIVDISDLLVHGSNVLEVQITTTLFNVVKANIDRIFSIGSGPSTPSYFTGEDWQEFGLIGPVRLRAFRRVSIIPSH